MAKAILYVGAKVASGNCAPQITVKGVKCPGQTISKTNQKEVIMQLPMKGEDGKSTLVGVPFVMADTNGIHESHQRGEVSTPSGTQSVVDIFGKLFRKLAAKPGAVVTVEYEINDLGGGEGGSVSLDSLELD